MTPSKPMRQLCPLCAYDDDVEVLLAGDEWVLICSGPSHPPFEWRPKGQHPDPAASRSGIAEELGVYETLMDCVTDGFAEYGVIEYRFWERDEPTYRHLVDRYGHTTKAPKPYTASAFLGGSLGQLWREQQIRGRWGPATGYWSYNGRVGTYASLVAPADGPILSWSHFATEALGVDPQTWPPLSPSQ